MSPSEIAALLRRWCVDIACDTQEDWISKLITTFMAARGTVGELATRFLQQDAVVVCFLTLLYRMAMDREPSDTDLAYWTLEYEKNSDILNCAAIFLASDEFYVQQCGGSAALFPSRIIAVVGCEGLGLDEARIENLASANRRADAVGIVLRHPSVRLRIATSLTFCLGLAEIGSDSIAAMATDVVGPGFVEGMLMRLMTHPRYVAQARKGFDSAGVHCERLAATIDGMLLAGGSDGAPIPATIRADIRVHLSNRRQLVGYIVDLLDRSNCFARLFSRWSPVDGVRAGILPAEPSASYDPIPAENVLEAQKRWKWLSFGDAAASLCKPLSANHNACGFQTELSWPAYRSRLLEIALPIVERWMALYGGFLYSVDQSYVDILNKWANRLVDSDGVMITFCEFIVSPVCCGISTQRFVDTAGQIAPPPGCFAVHQGPPYESGRNEREPPYILCTSYFYWYDEEGGGNFIACPDTLTNAEGADSLTLRPSRDVPFSYNSFAWHRRQLADMLEAGINVILPVSYTHPFSDPSQQSNPLDRARNSRTIFADSGLRALRRAWLDLAASGAKPPLIAMFYDTSTLNGVNVKELKIDFRYQYAFRWFYESIRNFFSHFPRPMWAFRADRPIVFVYHPCFGAHVHDTLYQYVRARFVEDFGTDLYIVTAAEEEAPRVLNADRLRPWAERLSAESAYDVLADLLSEDELYRASGDAEPAFSRVFLRRLTGQAPSEVEVAASVVIQKLVGRRSFVRGQLASDAFFVATMYRWFRRLLRVSFDVKDGRHNALAVNLRELLVVQGDVLGALTHIVSTPMFLGAAGGTNEFLIDWIYQSIVWTHPNPDCPNGSTTSTDIAGRNTFLESLARLPRGQAISDFLNRYEVREAIVSGWFFDHYGHYNPGRADARFYWSGAISPTIRDVASVGPGYDQSKLRNRPRLVMPRRDGETYRAVLNWMLSMEPRPEIVHLETWNEYFEGSCICDTQEFGRTYIDISRDFAEQYIKKDN